MDHITSLFVKWPELNLSEARSQELLAVSHMVQTPKALGH